MAFSENLMDEPRRDITLDSSQAAWVSCGLEVALTQQEVLRPPPFHSHSGRRERSRREREEEEEEEEEDKVAATNASPFHRIPRLFPDSLPCHVSAFSSFFGSCRLCAFVPFHATEDPEGGGFGREWVCRFVEPVIVLGSATKDSGVCGARRRAPEIIGGEAEW
ncbi:unnamed protein product [Arctogadus glacialis]